MVYIDDLVFLHTIADIVRDYVDRKYDDPVTPKVYNHIFRTANNLIQAIHELCMREEERKFTLGTDALCSTIDAYRDYLTQNKTRDQLFQLIEERKKAKEEDEDGVEVYYQPRRDKCVEIMADEENSDGDEEESEEEAEEEEEEEEEDDDEMEEDSDDQPPEVHQPIPVHHHPIKQDVFRGGKPKVIYHSTKTTIHFH